MLHVAQLGFFLDPRGRTGEQLLCAWPSLGLVAEAAANAGLQVSVLQACAHPQNIMRHGVNYYFRAPSPRDATAKDLTLMQLVQELSIDVLHIHGLSFPRETWALARAVPHIPILLQDHADRPPRLWRRNVWRRGFAVAAGLAFCAFEQARPFRQAGLISSKTRIFEIAESTSTFTPGDRERARRDTQITGDPGVLWVGHLDANKDPLTVLKGISEAARALPELQLWCCFGKAPLMSHVHQLIASDPALRGRVHLLGQVPHRRIESLMRAADVLVSGSHREGSGYAVIEALACGLPPVVTDIPSFRSLTGGGAVGRLWRHGDPHDLAAALISIASQPQHKLRHATRLYFEQRLSARALGRKLAETYYELAGSRGITSRAVARSCA